MRFEAKHQELKSIAQKTNNFVNSNKTIAEKHQVAMSLKTNKYCDQIVPGKVVISCENEEIYRRYESILQISFDETLNLVQTLKLNNFVFKSGLLLLHESKFLEISYILRCQNNYWFLCENTFDVKEKDLYCNSLIIEENQHRYFALSLNQLLNKRPFEKQYFGGKLYVFCDTLELCKSFNC